LAIDDQPEENYITNSMVSNMGNIGGPGTMMDSGMMN
jgi:hypothetical protein